MPHGLAQAPGPVVITSVWAAGEQGEAAFAQAAQRPLESVEGAGIDVEVAAAGRLAHQDVDADTGSFVSRVGQGGQARCGGRVERREHVGAGGGDVVHRARLCLRGPQREAVGGEDGLDVAAVCVRLT
jgi:hypothetical protein